MKRNFFIGALMLVAGVMFAQQPVITFVTTDHDFGKIQEADGRVSTIFEFKNEGMEPLVLSNVRASCGCTTPTWTKTPIEPGQTGTITVTYNPNGRPGKFNKTITVTSNATEPTKKLYIHGEVIPKQQASVNRYPVKMGDANITTATINFGTILNTQNNTKTIDYTNNTDKDITVEVLTSDGEPWIYAETTLITVKPKEVGQLRVNYDAKKSKKWGMQTSYIYLMVNGKKQINDEFKITLKANIEEDFSQMTSQDKQQAPIIEVNQEIDLGKIKAGTALKKSFFVKNAGIKPLFIRCINNSNTDVKATAKSNTVKAGKKAEIKVDCIIKADTKPGVYRRQIEIVSNDYKASKKKVTLVWTVE